MQKKELDQEQVENLKNQIFKTFADTKQPAKEDIALGDYEQCKEMRNDFAGIKWQEISDELLLKQYDAIPLFTPQAFIYFLPAFLIYTLKNFDSHSLLGEFTIYALTPDKKWNLDNMKSYWTERLSLLSNKQMEVIYDFLDLAKQNPIYEYEFNSIGKKIFDRLKVIRAIESNHFE